MNSQFAASFDPNPLTHTGAGQCFEGTFAFSSSNQFTTT